MIVKNWQFNSTGNPYRSALALAATIEVHLSVGEWPAEDSQEFYDKQGKEIREILSREWPDAAGLTINNMHEHICFVPVT